MADKKDTLDNAHALETLQALEQQNGIKPLQTQSLVSQTLPAELVEEAIYGLLNKLKEDDTNHVWRIDTPAPVNLDQLAYLNEEQLYAALAHIQANKPGPAVHHIDMPATPAQTVKLHVLDDLLGEGVSPLSKTTKV